MKKRKINILLNIATLCLCVAAIAFGVYSAKTASLNVSGTIGFNAHNCSVSVATTITGVATQDFGDKTTITKEAIAIDSTTSYTNSLALGDLFFTDKDTVNDQAAPIKMQFAISNKSQFAIKASVTLPTSNDVTILADKDSIKIDAGSNTAPTVGYITVTFKINNSDSDIIKLDFSTNTFKFDFTKFDTKKSDITVNYDSEGKLSNYYIEYGTGKVGTTTYGINWYIIGTYGSDGQIQKLTPASDLTTVTENSTYKMKDTIIYAFMSEYILTSGGGTTSETKYVVFNDNAYFNENDGKYYSNEYSEVQVNDYSISTVRAYLAGAKISTSSNFFIQNSLKDSNVYTLIQTRTLTSLYTKMSYGETSADIAIPTDKTEGIYGDDADAFWLLSYNESRTLWSSVDNCVGKILIPESSNISSYTVSDGAWLLRTPNTNGEIEICDCDSFGAYYNSGYVFALSGGVRPAFLI